MYQYVSTFRTRFSPSARISEHGLIGRGSFVLFRFRFAFRFGGRFRLRRGLFRLGLRNVLRFGLFDGFGLFSLVRRHFRCLGSFRLFGLGGLLSAEQHPAASATITTSAAMATYIQTFADFAAGSSNSSL